MNLFEKFEYFLKITKKASRDQILNYLNIPKEDLDKYLKEWKMKIPFRTKKDIISLEEIDKEK